MNNKNKYSRRKRPFSENGREDLTLEKISTYERNYKNKGYDLPKWLIVARTLLINKWSVAVYRAKTTESKYLYVIKLGNPGYKIRFSTHRPGEAKELYNDSDYYVGESRKGFMSAGQLLKILLENDKSFSNKNINVFNGRYTNSIGEMPVNE